MASTLESSLKQIKLDDHATFQSQHPSLPADALLSPSRRLDFCRANTLVRSYLCRKDATFNRLNNLREQVGSLLVLHPSQSYETRAGPAPKEMNTSKCSVTEPTKKIM